MTQNLSKVLAILIKQLCRLKKRIPDSLLALYKLRATNDSAPKLSELQASMETVVGSFTQVFLVIDAIDECSEADRKVLLPYIVKLFGECPGRLKIFATSRPEPDITRAFTSEMFNTIQIEAKKVDEDIKDYVKHELKHRIHEYCDIDEDLMSDIELTLTTKAGGM